MHRIRFAVLGLLALGLAACGTMPEDQPDQPDSFCPGGSNCPES